MGAERDEIDVTLDAMVDDLMESSIKIMDLKVYLEKLMQDGRLNISKARYCNSSHDSVSSLQFNNADMVASARVNATQTDDGCNYALEGEAKPPKGPNDPLRWFGILVPRPLKQAQVDFSRCLPIVCELASLQSRYLKLQDEFSELRKRRTSEVETLITTLDEDSSKLHGSEQM